MNNEYQKPSELPVLSDITGAEIAPVVKAGKTYRVDPELLRGAKGDKGDSGDVINDDLNNRALATSIIRKAEKRAEADGGVVDPTQNEIVARLVALDLWKDVGVCLIPGLYQAGKLYSIKPKSGVGDSTVTRASIKSRVNEEGMLENVAIDTPSIDYSNGNPALLLEPQRSNLLTYPVSFGHVSWARSGVSIEGNPSTAVSVDASDFSVNADNWDNDVNLCNVTGNHDAIGLPSTNDCLKLTATSGGAVFMRKIGSNYDNGVGATVGKMYRVRFSYYLTGTSITSISFRDIDGSNIYNQFNVIKDAWQSKEFYIHALNGDFRFYPTNAASSDSIYYKDIFIEEVQGFPSPHADYPDQAFKLVEDTSIGTHFIYTALAVSSGAKVSLSINVKKGERSWVVLYNSNTTSGYYFDLENGVVGSARNNAPLSYSITALANGYYNISITVAVPSTEAQFYVFTAESDLGSSYAGNGASGVYIFGAQLEEGSYPTSLIYDGHEGATKTRIKDIVNSAGENSVNLYDSTQGALIIDFKALVEGQHYMTASLYNDINNYVGFLFRPINNEVWWQCRVNNVQTTGQLHDVPQFSYNKLAVAWKDGYVRFYVNGVRRYSASFTTFTPYVLKFFAFHAYQGNENCFGRCRNVQIFNKALTDSELQTLTS